MSGQNLGGRPTVLTPAVAEQLRTLVRAGVTLDAAAAAAGVSARSVRRWRAAGELDLERELAAGEVLLGAVVSRSTVRSWRAAAYLLERLFPERWAPCQRLPARRG